MVKLGWICRFHHHICWWHIVRHFLHINFFVETFIDVAADSSSTDNISRNVSYQILHHASSTISNKKRAQELQRSRYLLRLSMGALLFPKYVSTQTNILLSPNQHSWDTLNVSGSPLLSEEFWRIANQCWRIPNEKQAEQVQKSSKLIKSGNIKHERMCSWIWQFPLELSNHDSLCQYIIRLHMFFPSSSWMELFGTKAIGLAIYLLIITKVLKFVTFLN